MIPCGEAQPVVELSPLGSEEEFATLLGEMVGGTCPRVFALVEEYGSRADGWIIAWGMAFEDHADVVSADGGGYGSFESAESAHVLFAHGRAVRLVWATHSGARVTSEGVARVVVDVMPKPEILDPQGQAVAGALARLGFAGVTEVRQGKHFELDVDDGVDDETLQRIAGTLLANPVIEDWAVRRVADAPAVDGVSRA